MENSLLARQKQALIAALARENELSERFGLRLSASECLELAELREQALEASGRVEFGEGILPRLIEEFCDSPFLTQENYAETLAELQESFYYFKSEAEEAFADDELLSLMKLYYDGVCQGSVEYLSGTSLEELARWAREQR